MNVGAFVCSCGDTCDVDLEAVRDGVRDVDVVASSRLLCEDGLPAMRQVIDEYDLDQLLVTAPDPGCQSRFRDLAESEGLHPEATSFVDHRESAGWVHERAEATDKTARLLNARNAGLAEEAPARSVEREAGERVAVVGDPEAAAALADTADVTLVADGREFADCDADLDDVTLERGRVVGVDGEFGAFEVRLRARVTEDCVSCMKCVREGPDGLVTSRPVDIAPGAPDGEWTECCPTDAIEMDGVERVVEFDQVVYPGGSEMARAGRTGYYTHVDAGTVAAVESLLGGVKQPQFLDLEMEVCASGSSSQQGCTACTDACPHDAVRRPTIDSVEFDATACQNCGACTSECPTGATMLREPSNRRIAREVEALLHPGEDGGGWLSKLTGGSEPGIETPVLAFVCSERAERVLREYGRRAAAGDDLRYPPVLPVRVNCTDTVGEAHVVHALAAGAEGVAVVGCGDSCLHSGPDPKAELVERLNTATSDLGLGERVTFLAPDGDDFEGFRDSLVAFTEGLDDTPVPAGEHEATGTIEDEKPQPAFNTHDWALESVRAILAHATPERDVIRGLETFGRMTVSDDCTFTPTCSNLCPTDAIRRTETELAFDHERCVNCGLCEEGCVENAITMETGLDLSLLPENNAGEAWTTVAEGEMLECKRCGKPFASEATAEKIQREVGHMVADLTGEDESVFEYCGDCRAQLVLNLDDR
ncbi:hydrogenase iron-sulfur subunit [Halomarina litorea]|uniref:hydrogenase iron-sulfur subunit n=1 Tax=Halomarina litorea TaxID=2961595 RepID=UPI0020C51573|nr:hydrogenase iron-sulfur subunit [Halomarina sp. BCD28]